MRVLTTRRPVESCQTEIANFEYAVAVYEQIIRFQISVEYPVVVQVFEALQCHKRVRLDVRWGEHDARILDDHFQIGVHEIEYERYVGHAAEYIEKADDVGVVQFLQ